MRRSVILLFSAVLLSACQTVPIHTAERRAFAGAPGPDQGVIRITRFQVPKDEPVTTFLLVLGAIGGAKINHPVSASVFDVTDQVKYLGTLDWNEYGGADWLEASVPAGPRRLMLALTGRSSVVSAMPPGHVDFLDVDVKANAAAYVVMSRQGFARFPYFYEIAISDQRANACSSLAGTRKERLANIDQYMAAQKIDPNTRDFKWFCMGLGDKQIQTPTAEAMAQFAERRGALEKLRDERYAGWKAEAEERKPYDLMRSYEPPAASSRGELVSTGL